MNEKKGKKINGPLKTVDYGTPENEKKDYVCKSPEEEDDDDYNPIV